MNPANFQLLYQVTDIHRLHQSIFLRHKVLLR